jgi:hypothetical protein
MSPPAAICGAISLRTAKPTITLASSSRRPFATGGCRSTAGSDAGRTELCAQGAVAPGEALPAEWGGGVNKWPWPIPLIVTNIATKPELVGHFAPEAPDFNLMVPDQVRVEIFLRHLKQWVADREHGNDTMPDFRDAAPAQRSHRGHTARRPTPKSSVADNDLAVGRAVEGDLALALLGRYGLLHS